MTIVANVHEDLANIRDDLANVDENLANVDDDLASVADDFSAFRKRRLTPPHSKVTLAGSLSPSGRVISTRRVAVPPWSEVAPRLSLFRPA